VLFPQKKFTKSQKVSFSGKKSILVSIKYKAATALFFARAASTHTHKTQTKREDERKVFAFFCVRV